MLSKKVKDLEVLGQSLIYQERELLIQFKDRAEEEDLEENNQKYERKGLLDLSSSDGDESDENDGFTKFNSAKIEEEKKEYHKMNQKK